MSEEKEETKEVKELYKCKKCGCFLTDDEEFCSKCGTERGQINNKKCKYCSAVLEDKQEFCPKCGRKVSRNIGEVLSKHKKKIIIILAILFIVILLAVIGSKVLHKVFITSEQLLIEGRYQEAYEKAKDNEKDKVCEENLTAYISKDIMNSLKDPTSFLLRNGWYDKKNSRVVLYTNGKNSYGGSVSAYDYYTFDKKDNAWELYCSLSDLDDEKIYSYLDSTDEKWEKIIKNAARSVVRKIIADDSLKIEQSTITNINNLFNENKLNDVTGLTCILPKNNSSDNDL